MTRTRHALAPTLLLLLPVALTASPAALPPPVIPACVGVNIHFTGQPAQDLNGIESAGFGWVRMDFAWADVEKTKGIYDFSAYDSLLAGLTARHIRPLFILDYGNPLYGQGPPRTSEARAAFARFAAAAATHYKGRDILWEIWNEPNGGFWPPEPDAAQYGALVLAAAHAIHAADSNATVMAPAMSAMDLPFFTALCRQGLLAEVDAVSFHPYQSKAPETAAANYLALRRLLHQYAPARDVPLVSSEWGYSTASISELTQAQYLAREWLSNLAQGIRLSIWYDWHDDGTDPNNREDNFGTVRSDYSAKPSYLAARTLIRALDGCRFVKRVPLASPDDYLLLFAHGQEAVRLAAWTTGPPHDILLPIPQVAAMTGLTGDALAPAIAQGRLRLSLSGSPVYLDVPGDAALRQAVAWTATPQDPFTTASEPLRLTLNYRNPDNVAHRVRFEAVMTAPDGTQTPIPGGADIVGPGRTLVLGMASSALTRVPVQVRVGLRVDGALQPYPQDIAFTPTDAITLAAAPLPGDSAQQVEVSNPSGEAFTGRLSAVVAGRVVQLPVRLAAGQTGLTLTPPGPAGAAWRLRDAQQRLISALPPRHDVPYPLAPGAAQALLDGDPKVPSTVQMQAVVGAQQVRYRFAPGWSFWRVSAPEPPALDGEPLAYGLWVNGDGSGNRVNIRYQDSTGQTFQAKGPLLDWTGWRFLTLPLRPDSRTSHWGGANDGQLHYPLRMNTLLLVDSVAAAKSQSGTILWKEPTVIYGAAAKKTLTDQ